MTATRPSPRTPGALLCPRCGNTLADEQAWCLECGLAARTRIHPPPSWRAPIVATAVALALAAAGIAVLLVAVFGRDAKPTPAQSTVIVPAGTPGATQLPGAAPGATTTPGATGTTPGATQKPLVITVGGKTITLPGTATTPGP